MTKKVSVELMKVSDKPMRKLVIIALIFFTCIHFR
jgi:hypothetical protein